MFAGLSSCCLFNNSVHLSRSTFVLSAPVCPAERGDAVPTLLRVISLGVLAPWHLSPSCLDVCDTCKKSTSERTAQSNWYLFHKTGNVGCVSQHKLYSVISFSINEKIQESILSYIILYHFDDHRKLHSPVNSEDTWSDDSGAWRNRRPPAQSFWGRSSDRPYFASNTPEPYMCWVDFTSQGGLEGGSCLILVRWCHAGLPVVLQQSVPPLLAVLLSLGKSSLPALSLLNRQSYCPCVCLCVCVCLSEQKVVAAAISVHKWTNETPIEWKKQSEGFKKRSFFFLGRDTDSMHANPVHASSLVCFLMGCSRF